MDHHGRTGLAFTDALRQVGGYQLPLAADSAHVAAADSAQIPISRKVFGRSMAHAMMGGLIVGMVFTVLFMPTL